MPKSLLGKVNTLIVALGLARHICSVIRNVRSVKPRRKRIPVRTPISGDGGPSLHRRWNRLLGRSEKDFLILLVTLQGTSSIHNCISRKESALCPPVVLTKSF